MLRQELRPEIAHPALWNPSRLKKSKWMKIRNTVLDRDNHTCQFCGHAASKWMNVHHRSESADDSPENLITCCVACHAILHFGRSLDLGIVEIWKSDLNQVEIVRKTREGVRSGLTLEQIKSQLPLARGKFAPADISWANELLYSMGSMPRIQLEVPLCAVFVNLRRWQLGRQVRRSQFS